MEDPLALAPCAEAALAGELGDGWRVIGGKPAERVNSASIPARTYSKYFIYNEGLTTGSSHKMIVEFTHAQNFL